MSRLGEDITRFFSGCELSDLATIGEEDVYGVFDCSSAEEFGLLGERPTFTCAVASLPSGVVDGTDVVIAGVSYKVRAQKPDGTGVVTLVLEEQ